MTTRKEIEDTRHDTEGLALMASKLGYRSDFRQLVMRNGASASDLFDFFDDNPGACEAVVDFVLEHGQDRDGNDLEDEYTCRECGTHNTETDRRCENKDCRFLLIAQCAACGEDVREEDSYGEGDIGDEDVPSFCSNACYSEGCRREVETGFEEAWKLTDSAVADAEDKP